MLLKHAIDSGSAATVGQMKSTNDRNYLKIIKKHKYLCENFSVDGRRS